MKALIGILTLMSVLSFTTACNKNHGNGDGIQREESIGGDDLRETDSYKQKLPTKDDGEIEENKDTIEMGPNDDSVED